ncbi:MAG: OmpA family protein [Fibrobacterota bacterium]
MVHGKGVAVFCIVFFMLVGCGRDTDTTEDIVMDPVEEEETTVEEEPIDTVDWDDVDTTALEPIDKDSLAREHLGTIYFDYDSYDLSEAGREKAIDAAEFLQDHDDIRIRLDGHCDERGSSEYNMALGENRAEAVYDILTSYGVSSGRIEITSFGKEAPDVAGCNDSDCHGQNRRVEFKVLRR